MRLGARLENGLLQLQLAADQPWQGRLVFDPPRHRSVMHLPQDYPRINQFPEWFTVEGDQAYQVSRSGDAAQSYAGKQLLEGLPVSVTSATDPLLITVQRE